MNSLSRADDGDAEFYTRKVLQGSGKNRCFAQVEVELWLDRGKNIVRHEVSGGRWLTAEEYEVELARFNAPPPEEDEAEQPESPGQGEAEPESDAESDADDSAAGGGRGSLG